MTIKKLTMSDDGELVIEIESPEGVSEEDFIETVGKLALHCDDLHRDLGGHGLKIAENNGANHVTGHARNGAGPGRANGVRSNYRKLR